MTVFGRGLAILNRLGLHFGRFGLGVLMPSCPAPSIRRCCGENPNIKSGLETIAKSDVGKAEEVAATIASYLASDDAAFVQGASLRVDGGRLDRL